MSKKCLISLLVLCSVFLSATPALSVVGMPGVVDMYILSLEIQEKASKEWLPRIATYTLGLLYMTSIIAFAIGYKDLALGGNPQLEGILALFVRIILITGMMTWLIKNPKTLLLIPDSIESLGGYIATGSAGKLSFSSISGAFAGILDPIVEYYQKLTWTSPGVLLVCLILVFFINCLGVLFIATLLLVRIETVFILIGGMFTAAFFILGYFRDVFMGFIKALVMNGIKLLLLSLCLKLLTNSIEDWKKYYTVIDDPAIIYNTIVPMTFALLGFYILIKSVPQYAVAILTGHASADGSLAKAAVMAGVGTAAAVWKYTSNPVSVAGNAVKSAGAIVSNAAQAFKKTSSAITEKKGSNLKANTAGVMSAVGAALITPLAGFGNEKGGSRSSDKETKNGSGTSSTNTANNASKPGGSHDPYKANESHNQEMEGRK